jgi:two-component system chemotaxis response regulator CheY
MNGVLIVDDLEFMRTALRDILTRAGIEVAGEGVNGREGVELYRRLRPRAVLLDITMPEMDGLSALRRIRREDPFARVIMCSAMGQETTILKAIRYGARDFVVKPFKPERIVSAVKKALDTAR